MKQENNEQKESQVQLFELFSVEELESRLEFKRKRRNGRGVSRAARPVDDFCNIF